MVMPYVITIAYVIGTNGIAPALAGPVLSPVRLPGSAGSWTFGEPAPQAAYFVALAAATRSDRLFAVAATPVEFHHLGLSLVVDRHVRRPGGLFLVVRESSRGTSRCVDALVESIDAASRGDFARVRPDGGSTSEYGHVAQSVLVLAGTVERRLRGLVA